MSDPELTPRQSAVLKRLRCASAPLTVGDRLWAVKDPGSPYGHVMGYDRAHAAVQRLVKLGLARRLPGRPARYEAT